MRRLKWYTRFQLTVLYSITQNIAACGVSGAVHVRYTYQADALQAFNNACATAGSVVVVDRF